ncbi:hypothetical protein QL285_007767 [Trifolium repens]|nr:hypothetical protein QL285_007767 [Trifolium repens]
MLNWDKEDQKGSNEGLGITYQRFGIKHEQKEIHAASTAALAVASGFARRASVTESRNMVMLLAAATPTPILHSQTSSQSSTTVTNTHATPEKQG